jgi:hypothetical protein
MSNGCNAQALGPCSHAEGSNTVASGFASHAEGIETLASNDAAHAGGVQSTASGRISYAEGQDTTASELTTHAEGYNTVAAGETSHAEGRNTQAMGSVSHAQGESTIANGTFSHSEGLSTAADGAASHAEGISTIASGIASHAEGGTVDEILVSGPRALGNFSHAEGSGTLAIGESSHGEGSNTVASGLASHAEGLATFSGNNGSHSEGFGSNASGLFSHAEGRLTIAAGENSHAEGLDTNTDIFENSHIMGRFGDANEANSWFIANGTSNVSRGIGAKWSGSTFNMSIDGIYIAGGADYAEMFETADGNPIDIGYFVAPAEGKKIRKATSKDSFILGITSATPSVLGNCTELRWQGKYIADEWGRKEYHEVLVPAVRDKEGNVIIPEKAEIQPVLNPNWNPREKYIPRLNRPEWVSVGLLGQILIRDDGTCEVHGYCWSNDDGIATKAEKGYFVLERTRPDQILILLR